MDKVTSACGICCLGWLCFPITLFILGSNEKNYVCTNNNILLAEKNSVETGCMTVPVDNKFIHLSCPLDTKAFTNYTVTDFIKGFQKPTGKQITFSTLSASMSDVEMYSCIETTTQVPDPNCPSRRRRKDAACPTITKYSYDMGWRANSQNSDFSTATKAEAARRIGCPLSNGLGRNPSMPTNLVEKGGRVTKGPPNDVKLAGNFYITKATGSAGFTPNSPVVLAPFAGQVKTPSQLPTSHQQGSNFDDKGVAVLGNYLQNCNSPFWGCVRLSFKRNRDVGGSIIANSGISGKTEEEPMAATWLPPCPKDDWHTWSAGIVTKEKLLDALTSSNENTLFFTRIFGVLGCWAAVFCCLYPIVAFFDIMEDYMAMVPCIGPCLSTIGQVVETLVTMVVCCMSCSFGCSAALFTIALVWLVMRPLQGMLMMAVCICLGGGAHALLQLVPKKGGEQARDMNQELSSASGEQA